MPGPERGGEQPVPPTSNGIRILGYRVENATIASATSLFPIHFGLMMASPPQMRSDYPS